MVKLTLLDQAKTKAEQQGRHRRHLRPQDPRAALRDRLRAELLQGLDPRALPQHRLLRRRRLRHPGRRPPLLRHQRQGPQPARSRAMLAGLVKNPTGYDPTNYPDRGLERRNVVLDRMAELNVITQRQGRASVKKQQLGLHVDARPSNGCVYSRAPFFCDYVVRYLDARPRARQDRRGPQEAALLRRPDHPHHDRPARPGRRRQVGRAATSSRRTRPSARLAMVEPRHRRREGDRPVPPDGPRPQGRARPTSTTSSPSKYGDSNGFQAGSTFKAFVLAAAIKQGIPLTHHDPRRRRR